MGRETGTKRDNPPLGKTPYILISTVPNQRQIPAHFLLDDCSACVSPHLVVTAPSCFAERRTGTAAVMVSLYNHSGR